MSVSLDAELVAEVMVLAGVGDPRDAVELVVRDYIARGHRTEALVAEREESVQDVEIKPEAQQG